MSSKFVSGGLINPSNGDTVEPPSPSEEGTQNQLRQKAQWEAVERELEKERSKRAEARRAAATNTGEKSLYEVLQANKAAKQAAFEEANRLKNQFRALDEDEVDFLETMMASSRAEEDRVRLETLEGIAKFRQEQQRQEKEQSGSGRAGGNDLESRKGNSGKEKGDDADIQESLKKSGLVDDAALEEGGWQAGGRKRKRRDGKAALLFKGLKKRASDLQSDAETESKKETESREADTDAGPAEAEKPESTKESVAASNLAASMTAAAAGAAATASPRAENASSSSGKLSAAVSVAVKKNAGEIAKRGGLVDYDSGSDSSD